MMMPEAYRPHYPAANNMDPLATAATNNAYELPDGTYINLSPTSKLGKNYIRLPELFFTLDTPFFTGGKSGGGGGGGGGILGQHHTLSNLPLHYLIYESLSAVGDTDIRKELANNIILTGGSSLYPNMEQRLSLEIPRLVPSNIKCRVIASSRHSSTVERSCSAWIGGSILTSLGSFQQLWLSQTEYDEYGIDLSVQRFP